MQTKRQKWMWRVLLLAILVVGTVFYLRRGEEITKLRGNGPILGVAFSPDGRFLAFGGPNSRTRSSDPLIEFLEIDDGDVEICLWDVSSRKQLFTRRRSRSFALDDIGITFSPDGQVVALGLGGEVSLFEVPTGQQRDPRVGGTAIAFSPDGKILVEGRSTAPCLIDVHSGKVDEGFSFHVHKERERIRELGLTTTAIKSVAFSPDGKLIATGDGYGAIRLWDMESTTLKETFKSKKIQQQNGGYTQRHHSGNISQVSFSPNGEMLASSGQFGKIRLWDVASGKQLVEIQAHETDARSVIFSPNGRILASGGAYLASKRKPAFWGVWYAEHQFGGEVKLWDAATGKELHCFSGHRGRVMSVAFSPDGMLLASGSRDGTVRIWDVSGYLSNGKGTSIR